MTGRGPAAVLPALAVLLVSAAPPSAPAPLDQLDQKEAERQAASLALAMEKAVLADDAEALVGMLPEDGLSCRGTRVPRDRLAADLRTPGTRIHDFFLGGGRPPAGSGAAPRPSLRELFAEGRRVKIVLHFTAVEVSKLAWRRPCVTFRVEGETYSPRICLLHRSGHYAIADLGDDGC